MDELCRFTDPWDAYGLRCWRQPGKSRLIGRLRKMRPRDTIPWRRGYLILRGLLGEGLDRVDPLETGYAYHRLLVLDWSTGFRELGYFTETEIRDYALLYGPPQDSVLGHYWYGLLGGETPREIERIYRRQQSPSLAMRAFRYSGEDV
jgi:hypothetical protein